jgi:hypothetical protein
LEIMPYDTATGFALHRVDRSYKASCNNIGKVLPRLRRLLLNTYPLKDCTLSVFFLIRNILQSFHSIILVLTLQRTPL